MDTTQRSSMRPSIGVIPFIVGVVAGGILGWLATTLVHTHAWRGRRRRVSPVQVQASLKGVDYPVDKPDLLARAQAAGADARVLEALTQLPEQRYSSPIEVSRALGKQA